MTDKPILFTVGSQLQLPLWKPLSEIYRLAFLSTLAFQTAEQMGIKDAIALESFSTTDRTETAKSRGFWLASIIGDAIADKKLILDPDIPELTYPGIGHWLPAFALDQIVGTMMRVLTAAAVLAGNRGAGVLVHEDVMPEGRGMVMFGKSEGLPTLHLPHANHFVAGYDDIHSKVTSEYIGARGTYMRDWYKERGISDDKITLVGAPHWDILYKEETRPSREHARRALGLDQDGLVLCYGTTWAQSTAVWGEGQDDLFHNYLLMLKAAQEMKAKLLVKVHPGSAPSYDANYQEMMIKHGVPGLITRRHNEYCLAASDCLISQGSSNLAVESTIAGTPVVELFQCSTRFPDWIKGTWGDELVDLIKEAIEVGPNIEFARAMNYDNDGNAIERCLDWIRELCPQ